MQQRWTKRQYVFCHILVLMVQILQQIQIFDGLTNLTCSGKARRGDGNDLTANPKKLAAIGEKTIFNFREIFTNMFFPGKELDKLGKDINALTPVSEVPFPTR